MLMPFLVSHSTFSAELVPTKWELITPVSPFRDAFYHNGFYWIVQKPAYTINRVLRSRDAKQWEEFQSLPSVREGVPQGADVGGFITHLNPLPDGIIARVRREWLLRQEPWTLEQEEVYFYLDDNADAWKMVLRQPPGSSFLLLDAFAASVGGSVVINTEDGWRYSHDNMQTWQRPISSSGSFGAFLYANNKNYIITGPRGEWLFSTDGAFWKRETVPRADNIGTVCAQDICLMVDWYLFGIGNAYHYTDTQGMWHESTFGTARSITSVSFADGLFFASGSSDERAFMGVSTDGVKWTLFPQEFEATFDEVLYSPEQQQWLAYDNFSGALAVSSRVELVDFDNPPQLQVAMKLNSLPDYSGASPGELELLYIPYENTSYELQYSFDFQNWYNDWGQWPIVTGTKPDGIHHYFRWARNPDATNLAYRLAISNN